MWNWNLVSNCIQKFSTLDVFGNFFLIVIFRNLQVVWCNEQDIELQSSFDLIREWPKAWCCCHKEIKRVALLSKFEFIFLGHLRCDQRYATCVSSVIFYSLSNIHIELAYKIPPTVFPGIVVATTILFWGSWCDNYSRETTIQGRKLFPEIRYIHTKSIHHYMLLWPV